MSLLLCEKGVVEKGKLRALSKGSRKCWGGRRKGQRQG